MLSLQVATRRFLRSTQRLPPMLTAALHSSAAAFQTEGSGASMPANAVNFNAMNQNDLRVAYTDPNDIPTGWKGVKRFYDEVNVRAMDGSGEPTTPEKAAYWAVLIDGRTLRTNGMSDLEVMQPGMRPPYCRGKPLTSMHPSLLPPCCLLSVSSLFPLCFLSVSSLFPFCSLSVSSLFPLCSLSVSSLFPLCFLSVSSLFPLCFLSVSSLFPLCFLSVSSMSRYRLLSLPLLVFPFFVSFHHQLLHVHRSQLKAWHWPLQQNLLAKKKLFTHLPRH